LGFRDAAAAMKLSDLPDSERPGLARLEARIGRAHLRHRLALEGEHETRVFRKGTHFMHLENWVSMHGLLRAVLTAAGLHRRAASNALRIEVRRNEVALAALPVAFDGCSVLHLSDLHLDANDRLVDVLAESLRDVPRDFCVLTGDYRFRTSGPHEPAMQALSRLRPHLGDAVFAVLGNHDTIRMVPPMEAMGIRVLLNESVPLQRGADTLWLAGIDDAHYFRTHGYHKAADGIPPRACSILLSHTPEAYRHAAHCGFALMLSGHTHGGQICLPGGIPILTDSDAPRAYARGAWRFLEMLGYTSVGCGSSIIDARLNCRPEIALHRLRAGQTLSKRKRCACTWHADGREPSRQLPR
jgi:predicted MPP superfamily phosphohydrolase